MARFWANNADKEIASDQIYGNRLTDSSRKNFRCNNVDGVSSMEML